MTASIYFCQSFRQQINTKDSKCIVFQYKEIGRTHMNCFSIEQIVFQQIQMKIKCQQVERYYGGFSRYSHPASRSLAWMRHIILSFAISWNKMIRLRRRLSARCALMTIKTYWPKSEYKICILFMHNFT